MNCTQCQMDLNDLPNVMVHYKSEHKIRGTIKCKTCNKSICTLLSKILAHIDMHNRTFM